MRPRGGSLLTLDDVLDDGADPPAGDPRDVKEKKKKYLYGRTCPLGGGADFALLA